MSSMTSSSSPASGRAQLVFNEVAHEAAHRSASGRYPLKKDGAIGVFGGFCPLTAQNAETQIDIGRLMFGRWYGLTNPAVAVLEHG
jgi:hypothetical protein